MDESGTLPIVPKSAVMKKKSIFTDVVHLAGLSDSNKSGSRESVLDLRTKSSCQQRQTPPNSQRSSTVDASNYKKSLTTSILDRSHSFSAFASPSFFNHESFPSLLTHPHSFHDFLHGGVLGVQTTAGAMPLCWPSGYGHTSPSFLSPLAFRSPFPSIPYNPNSEAGMGGDGPLGQSQHQIASGAGTVKVPTTPSAVTRVKQAPRFQCPDCSRVYSTFSGLSKHRQFHCAAQLKRQFGCKFCQKHYTSLGALKMHIRTHTLPCKCDLCGKAFSRPWLLQGHVRTHTGEKPFRCLHCGRAFADRSNLRAHLQTHSDVKKYRCVCCQKTFSRMSLLTKHESNGCPGLAHG